jgi:hypothetical protein
MMAVMPMVMQIVEMMPTVSTMFGVVPTVMPTFMMSIVMWCCAYYSSCH